MQCLIIGGYDGLGSEIVGVEGMHLIHLPLQSSPIALIIKFLSFFFLWWVVRPVNRMFDSNSDSDMYSDLDRVSLRSGENQIVLV